MVGIGIMFLISVGVVGAISIIADHGIFAALQVAGIGLLISSPLIFFGMKFVRFAENTEAETKGRTVDLQARKSISPHLKNDWKRKFGEFNLSQLNLSGWILFLSTITLILFESFIIANVLEIDADKPEVKVYAAISLVIGYGYFAGMKKILRSFGISIFHDQ